VTTKAGHALLSANDPFPADPVGTSRRPLDGGKGIRQVRDIPYTVAVHHERPDIPIRDTHGSLGSTSRGAFGSHAKKSSTDHDSIMRQSRSPQKQDNSPTKTVVNFIADDIDETSEQVENPDDNMWNADYRKAGIQWTGGGSGIGSSVLHRKARQSENQVWTRDQKGAGSSTLAPRTSTPQDKRKTMFGRNGRSPVSATALSRLVLKQACAGKCACWTNAEGDFAGFERDDSVFEHLGYALPCPRPQSLYQ